MEISFIHTQILVHLHVNKTNFNIKGFTLGLALKQRRKATWKFPEVNTNKGLCGNRREGMKPAVTFNKLRKKKWKV